MKTTIIIRDNSVDWLERFAASPWCDRIGWALIVGSILFFICMIALVNN